MSDTVRNNPAKKRYELDVEGHIAATYYELSNGVITFIHIRSTGNARRPRYRFAAHQGSARSGARRRLKVVAQCPFVKAYIGKHQEYADLLT